MFAQYIRLSQTTKISDSKTQRELKAKDDNYKQITVKGFFSLERIVPLGTPFKLFVYEER